MQATNGCKQFAIVQDGSRASKAVGLAYTSNASTLQLQSKFSWPLRFDRNPIFVDPLPVLETAAAR